MINFRYADDSVCRNAELGGGYCESKSYTSLYRMQTKKLQFYEKQKEQSRKNRVKQIL